MNVEKFPLLGLFIQLRKAGLLLGLEEYLLFLQALQGGIGVSDGASLKRLCQTLWVKSATEEHIFNYYFGLLTSHPIESGSSSFPSDELPEQPRIPSESDRLSPLAKTPEASTTSQIAVRAEDEIQVAQIILQSAASDDEILPQHYISSDEYFPITRRQMKQSWRYLRRPIREGPLLELDVKATVNEVARKGVLLEPVLVPQRINRAELLMLIDQGGSMVPFHVLSHRLVETALRGGCLGRVDIYYFHNCPVEYLYSDVAYQEYESIEQILNTRYSARTGVLVFSDAGASRGGFNQPRIDLTKAFLAQFARHFKFIAWLNPMPRSRWHRTTASEVMKYVPMFDLSRRGLDDAISALRGHPMHFIHKLRHNFHE